MLQLPLFLLRSSSQNLLCSLSSSVVRGPVFLRWFGLVVLGRNLAIQAETHSTGHSLNLLRILAKAFTFSSDASLNTSFMDFIQRLRSWSCSNICRPSIWIRKPYRPVSLKAVFLVYMTSATPWVSWVSFVRIFFTRLLVGLLGCRLYYGGRKSILTTCAIAHVKDGNSRRTLVIHYGKIAWFP